MSELLCAGASLEYKEKILTRTSGGMAELADQKIKRFPALKVGALIHTMHAFAKCACICVVHAFAVCARTRDFKTKIQ